MRRIWGIDPGWGITAVRVVMAIIFIVAGWRKFNMGLGGVGGLFTKLEIPFPGLSGPFIMLLELVGGIALLLGIATRWLGLLYALEFVVAAFYVKLPGGFDNARIDLMLLAGGILLFLGGPGKASVDEVWLEKS